MGNDNENNDDEGRRERPSRGEEVPPMFRGVDVDDFLDRGDSLRGWPGTGGLAHETSGPSALAQDHDAFFPDSKDGPQSDEHPQDTEDTNEDLYIPEDSFSMFYVAEKWSDHVFPVFIYLAQISMLTLLFINLKQSSDSPLINDWNIPVDVPLSVTIAQFIACGVSVFMAADFVDGVLFSRMQIIHDGDEFQRRRSIPQASLQNTIRMIKKMDKKWELSNLMRMSEGMFTVFVSFLFILQSTTVIDLFLNFAGVAFVSELDDISFRLSKIGFLGSAAQSTATLVLKHKVDWGRNKFTHAEVKRRNTVRAFCLAGIIICMWVLLSKAVWHQDKDLKYACKSVTLIVGETDGQFKHDQLRSFSGSYTITGEQWEGRPIYLQDQGGGGYIGYCGGLTKRWTVTGQDGETDQWDPCAFYELHSETTSSYDITQISEFLLWTGEPIDSNINCNDCHVDLVDKGLETHDDGSGDLTCGWRGLCKERTQTSGGFNFQDKYCDCPPGFFGDSCQFRGPCTEMRFQDDHPFENGASFHLRYEEDNKPLMVYGRPAYTLRNSAPSEFLLLFDGGRWMVINSAEWDSQNKTFINFNPRLSPEKYDYISDYVNEGSPENIPFRAPSHEKSVTFIEGDEVFALLCADCKADNYYEVDDDDGIVQISDCRGSGIQTTDLCQSEYSSLHKSIFRCKCENGFIGPLCQTRPIEGKLTLYLEHERKNFCSVCGERNSLALHQLIGLYGQTCLPFPRKPLYFKGDNHTLVSRQLGLNLNETHFSVFVSSNGRFFPKQDNNGANQLLCSIEEGSEVIFSMKRRKAELMESTHVDLAVLLSKNFSGQIIDPANIDCLTKASINEHECDGSKNFTLFEVDGKNELNNLVRVWVQFDVKVTQ